MLYGLELAQALMSRLSAAKVADRVLVLQLPAWPSRSPTQEVALAVVRGQAWHVLCAVDTWHLISSPPPALAARFARIWEWQDAGPDVAAIGDALVELAAAWWQETPDQVGVLDVSGALTHALGASDAGSLGNFVYRDPGRGDVPVTLRCTIGRERSSPRWPDIADLFAEGGNVSLWLTTADGSRQQALVRTTAELAERLPTWLATLRSTEAACAAWMDRLARVQQLAALARQCLAPLVSGGAWTSSEPFELQLNAPPSVLLNTAGPYGDAPALRVSAGADGAVSFEIGRDPPLDLASGHALAALLPALDAALEREARTVRSQRLVSGRCYRVMQAVGQARAGELVEFVEVTEVRPSGADVWLFHVRGERADGRSIALASDDARDIAVLNQLDSYLTHAALPEP